jgi:chromosome segregation ATPase
VYADPTAERINQLEERLNRLAKEHNDARSESDKKRQELEAKSEEIKKLKLQAETANTALLIVVALLLAAVWAYNAHLQHEARLEEDRRQLEALQLKEAQRQELESAIHQRLKQELALVTESVVAIDRVRSDQRHPPNVPQSSSVSQPPSGPPGATRGGRPT